MFVPMNRILLSFLAALGLSQSPAGIEPLSDLAYDFIGNYCLDCHDYESAKGDIVLDGDSINWNDWHDAERWTKVHAVLESGDMPPKKEDQPSASERAALLDWLDVTLTQNVSPGGTVIRRLNRREYEQSVSDTLGIPFSVPNSFPPDTEFHGFDNIGEGLVLSPPLDGTVRQPGDRRRRPAPTPPQRKRKRSPPKATISGPATSPSTSPPATRSTASYVWSILETL